VVEKYLAIMKEVRRLESYGLPLRDLLAQATPVRRDAFRAAMMIGRQHHMLKQKAAKRNGGRATKN
jgi:hypothetical protein